jgi:hypothetical protein
MLSIASRRNASLGHFVKVVSRRFFVAKQLNVNVVVAVVVAQAELDVLEGMRRLPVPLGTAPDPVAAGIDPGIRASASLRAASATEARNVADERLERSFMVNMTHGVIDDKPVECEGRRVRLACHGAHLAAQIRILRGVEDLEDHAARRHGIRGVEGGVGPVLDDEMPSLAMQDVASALFLQQFRLPLAGGHNCATGHPLAPKPYSIMSRSFELGESPIFGQREVGQREVGQREVGKSFYCLFCYDLYSASKTSLVREKQVARFMAIRVAALARYAYSPLSLSFDPPSPFPLCIGRGQKSSRMIERPAISHAVTETPSSSLRHSRT